MSNPLQPLQKLWENAVQLYRQDKRGSATYFNPEETAFLRSIGINAQEVYDYAEDFVNGGNPDLAAFLHVHKIRYHYFIEQQKGIHSRHIIDSEKLPARDDAASGIRWLPRIIVKAKAKLRGELPDETMYGCGGDRQFFQETRMNITEFLQLVADNETDDEAIIQAVVNRKSS